MATPSTTTPGQGILSPERQAERDQLIELLTKAYWMEIETVMSYIANSVNPDGVRAQEVRESLEQDIQEELGHAQQFANRIKELYGVVPGSLEFTAEQSSLQPPDEQVDIVHRLVARYPETFELARTADDVVRIHRAGKIASLNGLEGGHMIENSLAVLRDFARLGVNYMTLTHSQNTAWADAATDSMVHGGLTRFGEEVVREMNRLGMLVDLSHTADSTMWDVLRVTQAPVIYSHSSSRHFTPHPRNVPDDVLQAVARNGGVVMVNYVTSFIYRPSYDHGQQRDAVQRALRGRGLDSTAVRDSLRGWDRRNPSPRPDLNVVADHIEHIRDVAGVDHVGLGSDLDGIDETPIGLEDVSTFPALMAELLKRGWSAEDVKKVAGLNVLRVMRQVEAVAARLQRERGPSTAQIEVLDGWPTSPPWQGPVR